MSNASKQRPHVVVVGGGFAGLQVTRDLRKVDVSVTLLDRRNFHLFQPLLYQVATGELSPANIATPLRGILRKQKNARVVLEEVTSISLDSNEVYTTDSVIAFDYLVVATGAIHHYFGREEWRPLAPGLKTIENATEIRRQILGAFEAAERSNDPDEIHDLLTFVIVGGGPTGCELAGALAEISRHTLQNDFRSIQPADARIVLVESGDAPLDVYPEPLPQRAAHDLEKLGVEIQTQCRVVEIEPTHVMIRNKTTEEVSRLNTRTVLWAAGVKASPLGAILCEAAGIESDRGGRVPVSPDLSIPGHDTVFVCGDLAQANGGSGGEMYSRRSAIEASPRISISRQGQLSRDRSLHRGWTNRKLQGEGLCCLVHLVVHSPDVHHFVSQPFVGVDAVGVDLCHARPIGSFDH